MLNLAIVIFLCVFALVSLFLILRIHKILLVAVILAWMRDAVNAALATACNNDQVAYLLATLSIEYFTLLVKTLRALPWDQWMGIVRDMVLSTRLWLTVLEDDHHAVPFEKFSQQFQFLFSASFTSQNESQLQSWCCTTKSSCRSHLTSFIAWRTWVYREDGGSHG